MYTNQQSNYATHDPGVAQPAPVAIPSPVAQPSADDEAALLEKVHKEAKKKKKAGYGHMRTIETPEQRAERLRQKAAEERAKTSVTQPPKTDILNLASNDDLTVATLARQAHKKDQSPDDEVVISLR
jgi:hypothetical protein